MKRQENVFVLLLFVSLFFLLTSCGSKNSVLGQWINSDRDLIISEDNFEIIFHNTKEISSFRGILEIQRDMLVLRFNEYKSIDNQWHSLENSELENYIEVLKYKVKRDSLETQIESTGKVYTYQRQQEL